MILFCNYENYREYVDSTYLTVGVLSVTFYKHIPHNLMLYSCACILRQVFLLRSISLGYIVNRSHVYVKLKYIYLRHCDDNHVLDSKPSCNLTIENRKFVSFHFLHFADVFDSSNWPVALIQMLLIFILIILIFILIIFTVLAQEITSLLRFVNVLEKESRKLIFISK